MVKKQNKKINILTGPECTSYEQQAGCCKLPLAEPGLEKVFFHKEEVRGGKGRLLRGDIANACLLLVGEKGSAPECMQT